jgi:hypothetical protein
MFSESVESTASILAGIPENLIEGVQSDRRAAVRFASQRYFDQSIIIRSFLRECCPPKI